MNLSLTATVEASNTPPRVRLNVTDSDTGSPADEVTLLRVASDGTSVPVRAAEPLALQFGAGGTRVGLAYDYEAPFGRPFTYKVREQESRTSATVTLDADVPWLIHPGKPDLSVPLDFRAGSFDETTYALAGSVLEPMGRRHGVPSSDGQRKSGESAFVVATETLDEVAALLAVLDDGQSMLLNMPPALALGVATDYIHVGSVSVRRPSSIGQSQLRETTIPYRVVSRPVGGLVSQRSFADLLLEATDFEHLKSLYPTFAALKAGPV